MCMFCGIRLSFTLEWESWELQSSPTKADLSQLEKPCPHWTMWKGRERAYPGSNSLRAIGTCPLLQLQAQLGFDHLCLEQGWLGRRWRDPCRGAGHGPSHRRGGSTSLVCGLWSALGDLGDWDISLRQGNHLVSLWGGWMDVVALLASALVPPAVESVWWYIFFFRLKSIDFHLWKQRTKVKYVICLVVLFVMASFQVRCFWGVEKKNFGIRVHLSMYTEVKPKTLGAF